MQLSKEAIDEFKKIYFKEFKLKLTNELANELGIELLTFIKMFYRLNTVKKI